MTDANSYLHPQLSWHKTFTKAMFPNSCLASRLEVKRLLLTLALTLTLQFSGLGESETYTSTDRAVQVVRTFRPLQDIKVATQWKGR